MDASEAVKLIKEIGIMRLGGYDGCLCLSCAVQGVTIDVSCRKSSGSGPVSQTVIRVHSAHLDAEVNELAVVAQEVVNQIHKLESWTPIVVRLCEYAEDNPPKCVYCGKPREDADGYLCADCLAKKDPVLGSKRRPETRRAPRSPGRPSA